MNAKSDKPDQPYSRQLAQFAERLQKQIADGNPLDDIHAAIEDLLWDDESVAADIRRILEDQHKAGNLRDETFELVQRMVDRMVPEEVDTAATDSEPEEQLGDPFGNTTVIEQFRLSDQQGGDQLQIGSVLRDRYLLQQQVAGGSMGVVYKALDRRLSEANDANPYVAIKVLTPQLSRDVDALRALQQEAAKGRCLSHPNIVRFIDLDRDDSLYFIVMEWLDGRSLANVLDDNSSKNIDKITAIDIFRQVAKALEYAHRRGVVHADVKPGNIILTPNGEVKLFDFGIARVKQKRTKVSPDFDPGVLGAVTPAYSSMQVLTGEEPAASDDVFSLGCLMYRLIAGYRVFGPRNAAEAADEGMEPQRPQGLNDVEWAALRKALSYSRVSRFASPQEFVDAMTATVPIHVTQAVQTLHEPEIEGRRLLPSLLAATVLFGGAWGLYQAGLLDQLPSLSMLGTTDSDIQQVTTEQSRPVEAENLQGSLEAEDLEHPVEAEVLEEPLEVGTLPSPDDGPLVVDATDEAPLEEKPAPQEDLIDFSTLPPATVVIALAYPGAARTELNLTLRENEGPVIVDLVRASNIGGALVIKLEEVAYSGNRSPWESGQYQISDDSVVRFPPGQDRARFTVSMTPDRLREPDRQVAVLVREFDDTEAEFAMINLRLEDDDQRRFESGFDRNTVAFVEEHVLVDEQDPAVQINLVRYNPDQTTLSVKYSLHEITATEGEDYFVPGNRTVLFGPGQRSARILIPLVQDSRPEIDEAFVLEMVGLPADVTDPNIFRRIAVMIRDDDSNSEQAVIR